MIDGYVTSDGYTRERMSLERMSLNLPKDIVHNLRAESEQTYTTMTGLILSALQLRQFIKNQRQFGCKIILEDEHGKQREIVWF